MEDLKRKTGRGIKLGFVDSDTLPSYSTIYEKLQEYENLLEDKKIISVKEIPQKIQVRDFVLSTNDYEVRGFQRGYNACIDQILNGQ